ncbi:hypothetical protein FisN_8Hh346 [Fistulifera solaris]|uniref:Exocyst complex component Sec3 C-terminal domain-containing protein n=1 Tax=Fistulifera solaris TaxID=1519565 RepID=A0A1Z5KHG4_FISSO|nr:hypothetical protein FisN_8Hh346 [Fistulifera solaris]|eukprot:GAX25754.1 hypothetical protein FisN_8Hh346 [Fistulifera solaris]
MKGVRGIFRKSQEGRGNDDNDEEGGAQKESGGFDLKVNFPAKLRLRRRDRDDDEEEEDDDKAKSNREKKTRERAVRHQVDLDNVARPVYRVYGKDGEDDSENQNDDESTQLENRNTRMHHEDDDSENGDDAMQMNAPSNSKTRHIEKSAGTNRLNRILSRIDVGGMEEEDPNRNFLFNRVSATANSNLNAQFGATVERITDPKNLTHVANFAARVVVPPLKVDRYSIGGTVMEGYPETMQQETLMCFRCESFESQGTEAVAMSALQYPGNFKSHKRSLGLYGGTTGKGRNKLRYVLVARSTNKPLVAPLYAKENKKATREVEDVSERDDYDAMFAPEGHGTEDLSVSDSMHDSKSAQLASSDSKMNSSTREESAPGDESGIPTVAAAPAEEEISSFPVLVFMTLHHSGTAPDIRKLIRLDQLTTVQDLHSTVVQLAFRNGDTLRIDFDHADAKNEYQEAEGSMDKERFIWSLLQIHAMLCVSVVEHNAQHLPAGMERTFLPPLNVRNLDRAELQYVATVNGFLRKSEVLPVLLERHRAMLGIEPGAHHQQKIELNSEEKVDLEEVDNMAYDLMMGNFATRITLFQSEEERKDAEEILNSIDLDTDQAAVWSIAEQLSFMLQSRMRDLEAETCRRLIAWEDEKAAGRSHKLAFMSGQPEEDTRDSVDALALASLFKMLESLDTELLQMEEWLQDRAAAIKPLTDDCADIEEENRQLEQQWKSYEMLGSEIRHLLIGLDIHEELEEVLKNPAQHLVYDEDGMVDVEESEHGVEQIYEAGKALQEAIEYPRKTGGMHLRPVSQRAKGLTTLSMTFCRQLAQIIVTVMEQFKTEVVAGSDNGKVSKNDTHVIIARKIRDTQRKFQSALLGYLKLIEVLAALSPEMLPALRESYAEMVAEGILMKKRMKGYFQALPGKNLAYLTRIGKDIKDYSPPSPGEPAKYQGVNANDIKAALTELLPVIAREAYFTSALFGNSSKDQDGREKKRNFENSKLAVDKASQHFRYYISRTCGIQSPELEGNLPPDQIPRTDPMLCLISSIYLNEIMDNYIDREKKGGDHSLSLAYVRATILDLRKTADKQWVNWVEKQIEWIRSNDGVPIAAKRVGVFPSFMRFPCFLDHVMHCYREGRPADFNPDLSGIKVINYYMQKMASALLDSLRECANRESTDKQYGANVMLMENTYYFTQAMKERGSIMEELFAKQIAKANTICKDSTDAYLGWMIKREFTALHDLFSRVSKLRKNVGDSEVAKNIPKNQFVRLLTKEANRDILKEKISSMFGRMEKHLSEEGGLLPVAWKALVKVLYEWFGRWEKLSSSIYRHKLDPNPVDVVRIAKAAGGGARSQEQQQGGSEFAFKNILALGSKAKNGED